MKLAFCATFTLALLAQPAVKRIPADGIAIPAADRAELESGLAHLQASIAKLKPGPLLPDVLIYSEAVRFSLQYNEFFKPAEIAAAKVLLQQGEERATQLAAGQAPWTTATGLVVRGYRSKIDQEHPTLRPRRAGILFAYRAASLASRYLVSRARRSAHPSQLPHRASEVSRRIHTARHHRAAPLRPLLQRQQVRR